MGRQLAPWLVLLGMGLGIGAIFLEPGWRQWRRRRLQRRSLPALWQATVTQVLPMYEALTPGQRQCLTGHIQVFLAEKQFIGCGGLEVTPEMRVTVAAIAALLLLNERGSYFARLRSILIYPSTYWVQETTMTSPYIMEERRVARLGESWHRDQVVLSWAQVQHDLTHWTDGHNVVLHEFAHQLDQEDGQAQGVPILPPPANYEAWAQVMTREYHRLCAAVERGQKTILDAYGATNPAEFFAVATETFFEKPYPLHKHHSGLYEQLQNYYHLDPMQWQSDRRAPSQP